jgi:hypothetical protein
VGIDGGTSGGNASTTQALASFNVYGPRLVESGSGSTAGYTSTQDPNNSFDTSNGILTNESITEAGEFFEFSQEGGGWSNTSGLTFGLFDETTYDLADLQVDEAANAVKAIIRLRLQNVPFVYKDPNADYGRLHESGFSNSPQSRETYRVGLDSQRRAYIAFKQDDDSFEVVTRTEKAIVVGSELKFVAIFPKANIMQGVRGITVNTIFSAPTLTWYYIESPDGVFNYPLFSSEEEANYADEQYGTASTGAGQSHAHTFIDEQPTSQVWYMPDSYMFHDQSSAPSALSGVVYNEIPTGEDSNYVPSQFGPQAVTINEGSAVNLQIVPAGDANSYNLTGVPAGLAFNGLNLVGTAPEVAGDNVTTPSQDYVITVTKANDYGSSVGTLTITVNNLTAPVTDTGDFSASTGSIVNGELQTDSVADHSVTLAEGERVIIPKAWVDAHVAPNSRGVDEKVFIGVLRSDATINSIELGDFAGCIRWSGRAGTASHEVRMNDQLGSSLGNQTFINNGSTIYNYALEKKGGELWLLAGTLSDLNSQYSASEGGTFARQINCGLLSDNGLTGPHTISIATFDNAVVDLDDALTTDDIFKVSIPAAPTMLTSWTKALDFSGGSERAQMVSTSGDYIPMMMSGAAQTTAAQTGGNGTVSNGRPWATACVFKIDGYSSVQHIWNAGEGAGSNDDNIYLRTTGNGSLFFGWGRSGALNEHLIASNLGTASWYGVYIGFTGRRMSGSDATASNLAANFQIKLLFQQSGGWDFNPNPTSPPGNGTWTSTGGRMDRSITGSLTIGGRGANRSYHGKVASFVTTTLKCGDSLPSNDEIIMMVTDPIRWMQTYKEGNTFRPTWSVLAGQDVSWDSNSSYRHSATQIWLMGDGTNDSYSNMIRNQVNPADQNFTRLSLISMQSNDIQTVPTVIA